MVDKVKTSFQRFKKLKGMYSFRLSGWRPRPSQTFKKATQLQPVKASHTKDLNLLQLLETLVEVPSVTGNYEANHQIIEFIDNYLHSRGMHVRRYSFNGVESLVATTQSTMTPKIMLNAHVDVVPGEPDIFKLRQYKDRLYGRGTFDNKGAAAVFLKVVDDLQADLSRYDFGIMINTDEEVGGFDGALKLVEMGYKPAVCVCPDGGDNWAMESFARGLWHFTLTSHGVSAHGSRPWEGKSAIHQLLQALEEMQALFDHSSKDNSTINIGTITGGEATNQLAKDAAASIDIRFAKVEDEAKIKTAITEICSRFGLELTTDVYSSSSVNDPEIPLLKAFRETIADVIGEDPGITFSYAQTDARHFADAGIPCAITRPPGGGHHGPEEWVSQKAFEQLHTIVRNYVTTHALLK